MIKRNWYDIWWVCEKTTGFTQVKAFSKSAALRRFKADPRNSDNRIIKIEMSQTIPAGQTERF